MKVMPKRFTILFAGAMFIGVNAQAQPPEEGRSLWDHNGSIMYLVGKGSSREFYYQKPRPGMLEAGAHPDDLLFKGQLNDGQISGIAYIFNAQCGQVPFHVKGPVLDSGSKIVLTGPAPHVGRNCQATGEYASTLEFRLLKTSEVAQPPFAAAQTTNVEAVPDQSPSDGAEANLSDDPSAQPTRTRQTPWVTDPWPKAPPSGVVAPKSGANSLALKPPPAQPPSIQEPKSGAGEAKGAMDKNLLVPLISALNVALPLFSLLFLVKVLRSSG